MKTPSDPRGASAASPPQDPVVSKLAERLRASSSPAARALIPLSGEERRTLAVALLGPAPDGEEGAREAPTSPLETSSLPPAEEAQSPAPIDVLKTSSLPPAGEAQAPAPTPILERPLPAPVVQVAPTPPPPRRRAPRWWPMALAAALGLFAAPLLWFRGLRTDPAQVAYDLRAQGDVDVRGEPPLASGAPLRLRPSTRLLVVLTPRGAVPDAALRMLVVRDGKARIVRPPFENDGQGKLAIDRTARDALGDQENGPAEIVWIIGRPMPEDAEIERIALDPGAKAPPGTVVLRRSTIFLDWQGAPTAPGPSTMESATAPTGAEEAPSPSVQDASAPDAAAPDAAAPHVPTPRIPTTHTPTHPENSIMDIKIPDE